MTFASTTARSTGWGALSPAVCAGTTSHATEPVGEMFRLDMDLAVASVLDGFVCFNGPCFSPDGGTLYLTGRDMTAIEVFDYNMATGAVSAGRKLIDGIIQMARPLMPTGCVWSAHGTINVF